MDSPPTMATATGRKSGSTRPRAATGNKVPLVSTSDSSGGPVPGRGATPVTLSRIPTRAGRPVSTVMISQVRGRTISLNSSTRSTVPEPFTRRAPVGGLVACEVQEEVLEATPLDDQLPHPHAILDQRPVEVLGSPAVQSQDHGSRCAAMDRHVDPAGELDGRAHVGGLDPDPTGRCQ